MLKSRNFVTLFKFLVAQCCMLQCIVHASDSAAFNETHQTDRYPTYPKLPGYTFAGACKLDDAKFASGSFLFANIVKHGCHAQKYLQHHCHNERLVFRGGSPLKWQTVHEFVSSKERYKVVPVREHLSFYKSLYNHICNKKSKIKIKVRTRYSIDCSKRNELPSMASNNVAEMADAWSNIDRIKELIVLARPKHLMFIDYKALGQLTDPLCKESLTKLSGIHMNSAVAQGYTDYWSAYNVSEFYPTMPVAHIWDDIYPQLERDLCLHFEAL